MAGVNSLLKYLDRSVIDADPELASAAILRSVRSILQDTQVLTDYVRLSPQPGMTEYILDVPEERVVLTIEAVLVDGKIYSRWTRDSIYNVVRFADDLSGFGCVEVRYSWGIKPDQSCDIPDVIVDRFLDAIIDGAKYYLCDTVGSDYYNPQYAALYKAQFDEHLSSILAQKMRSFTSNDISEDFRRDSPRARWHKERFF